MEYNTYHIYQHERRTHTRGAYETPRYTVHAVHTHTRYSAEQHASLSLRFESTRPKQNTRSTLGESKKICSTAFSMGCTSGKTLSIEAGVLAGLGKKIRTQDLHKIPGHSVKNHLQIYQCGGIKTSRQFLRSFRRFGRFSTIAYPKCLQACCFVHCHVAQKLGYCKLGQDYLCPVSRVLGTVILVQHSWRTIKTHLFGGFTREPARICQREVLLDHQMFLDKTTEN